MSRPSTLSSAEESDAVLFRSNALAELGPSPRGRDMLTSGELAGDSLGVVIDHLPIAKVSVPRSSRQG
jgi:hypothetical protein